MNIKFQKNSVFAGGEPNWANACVGNNGNPGYWEYATGFSQAANMLIDMVIDSRGGEYPVDTLIYPVCFNMRHSIELCLKGAIEELEKIATIKNQKFNFDKTSSHDIGIIWKFFSEKAITIDSRYSVVVENLESLITDIAAVDATGQTFRYPLNTESSKHLVDVSVINFFNLKERFRELEALLDDLHAINEDLLSEYILGTFTKNLSRERIFSLASFLPLKNKWCEESFQEIKVQIKDDFSISGRELSLAIDIIQNHYELAPNIGLDIPLLGINDSDLDCFFSLWFRLHGTGPIIESSLTISPNTCLESKEILGVICSNSQIKKQIWDEIKLVLTPEKLAGLSALFYFARYLLYSENYIGLYKQMLEEAKESFESSETILKAEFFHIMNKSNADNNMLLSLYFLRKNAYADKVVSEYKLEDKFEWLSGARDRSRFLI